mmetsp:Transcript_23870/g.28855  ORF Transcript_23870/g.28855 Transcript_23870/m.28855 type:complete len:160 (+) Transcript_23870:101-580(+)|eukprot:CAMPEP_0197847678 /NCGR_PEP_ID=MMETSP1438-20131217/6760_1 /TAXON_ID=1461541 /ORGANISM="Pterosperma sp., Strain CCMP1384" /LENGTH=159 /DNA_ID=CAMNT_0043459671 /DNA_START=99 /DNA_END=578 /DNA_ORIENTATION=+
MLERFLPDWVNERLGELLVGAAKLSLWIQVIFSLIGSTAYAYSSVHGSAVGICVAGLIALETGTKPYIRLYCLLLGLMICTDLIFLSFWSVKIAKNDSSIVGEYNANEYRDSEKFSLSAVFITMFARIASVPIWGKFLYSSYNSNGSADLGSSLLADEA